MGVEGHSTKESVHNDCSCSRVTSRSLLSLASTGCLWPLCLWSHSVPPFLSRGCRVEMRVFSKVSSVPLCMPAVDRVGT